MLLKVVTKSKYTRTLNFVPNLKFCFEKSAHRRIFFRNMYFGSYQRDVNTCTDCVYDLYVHIMCEWSYGVWPILGCYGIVSYFLTLSTRTLEYKVLAALEFSAKWLKYQNGYNNLTPWLVQDSEKNNFTCLVNDPLHRSNKGPRRVFRGFPETPRTIASDRGIWAFFGPFTLGHNFWASW